VLGVCLGHQAIGLAFGARLVRSEPCHGKRSLVLWRRLAVLSRHRRPIEAMRYHSLSLTDVRPPLRTVAVTQDGIVMAVEHESLPIAGVQFHPDSCGTLRGEEILAAFFRALT